MGYDIDALMQDAENINSVPSDFIEDQVHAFRKTIVAGLYFLSLFPTLRVFR
jgi:hypothetical protein